MTNSTALTGGNVTSLRKSGHTVTGYLYPVPLSNVATARINQATFDKPLASLTVDNTSGWADVEPGMTYWIGTTAGARDIHVGRVRGSDGTHLLTEEFTDGDLGVLRLMELENLVDDAHVTVKKDYGLHSVFPRIVYSGGVDARSGTFYKDYDTAYTTQNETAPEGIVRIGAHRVSRTSPATFAFTAFSLAFLGSVDTYSWDVDGGNITAGADDEQSVTVEWTTGFYVISCTITYDTGATSTGRRFVWVNQTAIPVNVQSDTRDAVGRRMTFTTAESISTLPDGVMAVYHEEASWGGDSIAEATTQFVGFVSSIEHAQSDSIQRQTFEMVSPMVAAQDLVAFSQELTMASDPDNWQQAIHALLHIDYWAFYLMRYHSTLLTLFDLETSGLTDHLTQAWSVQAGSLGGALTEAGERLNCSIGQDSRGTIFIKRNPQYMATAARDAVIERMTITEADIKLDTLNWGNNRIRNTVGRVEGSGFAFDGATMTPLLSQAPGFVGGQGSSIAQLQNQLLYAFGDPQAELNQRTACAFALENNPYDDITFTLFGDYDVFEPSEQYWVRLNISATYGPNGQAFNERCLLKTVAKRHMGGGAVEIDVALAAEVYADAAQGQTIPITPDSTYNAGVLDGNSYSNLPTMLPTGLMDFSYDPFTPPNYAYPPTVYTPPSSVVTAYVLAWTADILYNSANRGTTWGTLYNPSDDIISFVHDNESGFLTDPNDPLKGWILTDAGLEYNDDMLGAGTWDNKQAIEGGLLIRKVRGVTDAIGVYHAPLSTTWTKTFDFTTSDEDWILYPPQPRGTWTSGQGWVGTLSAGLNQANISFDMPAPATLTSMVGHFHIANAAPTLSHIGLSVNYIGDTTGTGGAAPPYGSGANSKTVSGTVANVTELVMFLSTANASTGACRWTSVEINGTGYNPFEDLVKVTYSDDTGDTVTETDIDLYVMGEAGYDVDDYNQGIQLAAANHQIWFTTAYDGAFTALTGLTGLDGENLITAIRIPFLTLLDQDPNSDNEALQFLYATNDGALWAVTFDSTDGSLINQTDISISISGTDYAVVGANAIETAGVNTQVILAFVEPVGGGTRRLVRSTNGGGSWAIAQTLDGDFVRFVEGSQQTVWFSGGDGIRYSTNRGSTLQNKTAGTTGDVLGVQGF